MSDYFGALIRSSGLRIGPRSAAPAASAAASDGLVEIHEEREAQLSAAPTAPPQREEPSAASSAPAVVVESTSGRPSQPHPAASTTPPDIRPAHSARVPAPPDGSVSVAPRLEADATPGAPVPRSPLDPVRIAMQWVAADPEARAAQADEPRVTAPGPPSPPIPAPQPRAEVVSRRIDTSERVAPPIEETRPRTATGQPAVRAIATPVHRLRRDAERTPAAARDRRSSEPAEEIVEISIGAINLHVEGPAPHTSVQTQPAPRPQPASRRRERSGLARRYLRSF